ncbi:MAG: hypothetical protein U0941_25250 [Planctomycetaceae bacterium]
MVNRCFGEPEAPFSSVDGAPKGATPLASQFRRTSPRLQANVYSCYHRNRFLEKDRTRQWFVDAIDKARSNLRFDLWDWVVMPEYVHLLAVQPHGLERSSAKWYAGHSDAQIAIAELCLLSTSSVLTIHWAQDERC